MRCSAVKILVSWAILAISAGSSSAASARLWLADLQRAEEMVAAAVETADIEELQRQAAAVHRLTGRARSELNDEVRFDCILASSSLANVVSDLRISSPARALVAARADAGAYERAMGACEHAVGLKGVRRLRL